MPLFPSDDPAPARHVWQVGALCRAVSESLQARFGAITVQGEISSFSRAASGHCYFTLKDDSGQMRSVLFRRAASLLSWPPRDGDMVEIRGRLALYEARGDLQLVAESMRRAGSGALYEDFLRRKALLQAQGLFDPARKRPVAAFPRGIGLVTSQGAAALHDVVTTLQRRVPHIPVVLAPAQVQGAAAPASLIAALQRLYRLAAHPKAAGITIDTIVLVRGGGSIEDLWAFNDVALAHTIAASPVPLICGVGHETDITIADLCADMRAPTPTAAAEMAATPASDAWQQAASWWQRLRQHSARALEQHAQRLDRAHWALTRTAHRTAAQHRHIQTLDWRLQQHRQHMLTHAHQHLLHLQQRLHTALRQQHHAMHTATARAATTLHQATCAALAQQQQHTCALEQQLRLLDPRHALARGYALLQNTAGHVLHQRTQFHTGQTIHATVSDGTIHLTPLAQQQDWLP